MVPLTGSEIGIGALVWIVDVEPAVVRTLSLIEASIEIASEEEFGSA